MEEGTFQLTEPNFTVESEEGETLNDQKKEHLNEVTTQLLMTRKKHDQVKEENQRKQLEAERLKMELSSLQEEENSLKNTYQTSLSRIQGLESELDTKTNLIEHQIQDKKIYTHMLSRVKYQNVCLKHKSNDLQATLKQEKYTLQQELQKTREFKAKKHKSLAQLKELKVQFKKDQRRKTERVKNLEKNVEIRTQAALRRQQRLKRQAQIAEDAANQHRNREEIYWQQQLMLHRFWYLFLKNKLHKQQMGASEIESAFLSIRASTSYTDPHRIVKDFAEADSIHQELLEQIKANENQLTNLKNQNKTLTKEFKELVLIEGETSDLPFYKELEEARQSIYKEKKLLKEDTEKLNELYKAQDKVSNWCRRLITKLEIKEESCSNEEEKLKLNFQQIQEYVSQVFQPLLKRSEEVKQKLAEQADKTAEKVISELITPKSTKEVALEPQEDQPLGLLRQFTKNSIMSII